MPSPDEVMEQAQAFFWRRLKRYKNNSLPFCHCANGLFSLKPELFNAIALPHL
jgi:hypothetical protein